jgi:hypothetical protein
MVQHNVIFSHGRIKTPHIKYKNNQATLLTLFVADPPPSHPNGFSFFSFLLVDPIFTGLKLPIFSSLRQAGPGLTPSL